MNGKLTEISMQVPLCCPGKMTDFGAGLSSRVVCGTNVYEFITVGMYTRNRLKLRDRKFDQAVPVGHRFRCISCGHVLGSEDFNGPMSGPTLKPD